MLSLLDHFSDLTQAIVIIIMTTRIEALAIISGTTGILNALPIL